MRAGSSRASVGEHLGVGFGHRLAHHQCEQVGQALARLRAAGLPYISVLTHPTTGGVSASFAMLGDINIAEPGALIGFAGPRVIEQTVREKLPEGFQRSEFLLDHGAIDQICDRREMRDRIAHLCALMMKQPQPADDIEIDVESSDVETRA